MATCHSTELTSLLVSKKLQKLKLTSSPILNCYGLLINDRKETDKFRLHDKEVTERKV